MNEGELLQGVGGCNFVKVSCVYCICLGMQIASTDGKRQRKRFFFEKKNQKTFTNSG
jgi:hypothetical protein